MLPFGLHRTGWRRLDRASAAALKGGNCICLGGRLALRSGRGSLTATGNTRARQKCLPARSVRTAVWDRWSGTPGAAASWLLPRAKSDRWVGQTVVAVSDAVGWRTGFRSMGRREPVFHAPMPGRRSMLTDAAGTGGEVWSATNQVTFFCPCLVWCHLSGGLLFRAIQLCTSDSGHLS